MSWLARSLSNSLNSEFDEDTSGTKSCNEEEEEEEEEEEFETPHRGVEEDLSQLTQALTRRILTLLAPPPPSQPSISNRSPPPNSDLPDSDALPSQALAGMRSDLAEIGGTFRNGISRLSAVAEISKIASGFLPIESVDEEEEEEDDDECISAVGVTDEVLAFARNISMHPETWLDFPLFMDDDYVDDFDMSDAQQEHALVVERLTPRLAALRIELCPHHMTEGCFWKIYFVLLHSRLNKHDAELLLTPQIVEARAMWLQELQNQMKPEVDRFGNKKPVYFGHDEQLIPSSHLLSETTVTGTSESSVSAADFEAEEHPIAFLETRMIDKAVVEEGPVIQSPNKDLWRDGSKALDYIDEGEGDDWLEDTAEIACITVPLGCEDDFSFSDLEDDDDRNLLMSSKMVTSDSLEDSRVWIKPSEALVEPSKNEHTDRTRDHEIK